MAEPIKFPEANFTWRGWAEDENQVAVGDLHLLTETPRLP